MSDRRPCRNDEDWRMCRLRWWLADRLRGRKVFHRVSYRGDAYFIDLGQIDPKLYSCSENTRMDFHIYDHEADSPESK